MESRKGIIVKLSLILLGMILVLTFFSNTIHNLDVAGVVVGFETDNIITTTHRSEGFVEIPETLTPVYAQYAGRIFFYVEDGDTVAEGDPLFRIAVPRDYIMDLIANLRNRNHSLLWVNQVENNQEIERLQRLLATDENIYHIEYAREDSIVRFVTEANDEMQVEGNQEILRLAIREGRGALVNVYFPESFDIVADARRTVQLSIPSLDIENITGEVRSTRAVAGRLRSEITFNMPRNVYGGERVEVVIEDFSTLAQSVLPNYAIREDDRGDFILSVRQEQNTLIGYSYFAQRVEINVLVRGDHYTSFMMFDELEEPIILQSDRPIVDGDRIQVVGER